MADMSFSGHSPVTPAVLWNALTTGRFGERIMGSRDFVPRIGSQCYISGPSFFQAPSNDILPEKSDSAGDDQGTASPGRTAPASAASPPAALDLPLATSRVIDVDNGRSLCFLWMSQNRRPATVTITFMPSGDGSLVEVTHAGDEGLRSWPYRRRVVEPFWRAVLRALRDFDVLLAGDDAVSGREAAL